MQITAEVFRKVVEHVKDELLKQLLPVQYENGYGIEAVAKATILSLPQLISLDGFLAATGEKKERRKASPTASSSDFMKWWGHYPASGNFSYRGMKFTSSRVLRSNMVVCEMLFNRALLENNLTSEQMIKALLRQIQLIKEESYEKGENRLQYFSGSEPYLRQQKFLAFIGEDAEEEETEKSTGTYGA